MFNEKVVKINLIAGLVKIIIALILYKMKLYFSKTYDPSSLNTEFELHLSYYTKKNYLKDAESVDIYNLAGNPCRASLKSKVDK